MAVVVALAPALLTHAFSIFLALVVAPLHGCEIQGETGVALCPQSPVLMALIDALPTIRSASLASVPLAMGLFFACRSRHLKKLADFESQSSVSK